MSITDTIVESLITSGHRITDELREAIVTVENIALAEQCTAVDDVLTWLAEKRKQCLITVEETGVRDLPEWNIDPVTYNISHSSGKFFSIIGVHITRAIGREVATWSQPMLKQEECGISGLLCQKKENILRYLFYAKFEPGNIHLIQLSPALQVTASNLAQAHHGKKPFLAEYFEEGSHKGVVCKSVVGVEDGGRFYRKTNKSMIVEIPEGETLELTDDYIWLTIPQIKKLLEIDYVMNSLARNVCALI